jgi:hypothetical protein
VPPDELDHYSTEFEFRKPCCPCALGKGVSCYTEAEVVVLEVTEAIRNDPLKKLFIGEYIAKCAANQCGFFGMCPLLLAASF